eukprot:sb/3476063/
MSSKLRYYLHSGVAGCFGAAAGISAKCISEPTIPTPLCIAALIFCNLLMWLNFTAALQGLRTVEATACTTIVNFLCAGGAGWALFGEVLSWYWCGGIGFIVSGVLLLSLDSATGGHGKTE